VNVYKATVFKHMNIRA